MTEPRIPNPEELPALNEVHYSDPHFILRLEKNAEEIRRLSYERALEYLRTHQLPDWTPADGLFGIRGSDED